METHSTGDTAINTVSTFASGRFRTGAPIAAARMSALAAAHRAAVGAQAQGFAPVEVSRNAGNLNRADRPT